MTLPTEVPGQDATAQTGGLPVDEIGHPRTPTFSVVMQLQDSVVETEELPEGIGRVPQVSTLSGDLAILDAAQTEEQLRCRIRQLEEQMYEKNVELDAKASLGRNYEAVVLKLGQVQTEKQVLEGDRERYYNELNFSLQQAEEMTTEKEVLKERLQETNKKRIDSDKKIKELEKEVRLWKEKYEHSERNQRENPAARSLSFKEDTSGSCNDRVTESSYQTKRRRHTFHQSPTVLPRCKNCSAVFDRVQPHEVQCRFHRSGPQPLKTWQKQLADIKVFDTQSKHNYMFWPCCGQMGVKEPPGCLKLRSHDLVIQGD